MYCAVPRSPNGGANLVSRGAQPSGRSEVYISTFPEAIETNAQPVSRDGEEFPAWSRDGRELFYWNDDAMMVVVIDTGLDGSPSEPQELLRADYVDGDLFGRLYDVAEDGRFLLMKTQTPPSTS
jgi:hypothetical protein